MDLTHARTQFLARDGEHFDVQLCLPKQGDKFTAILMMSAIFGVDEGMQSVIESYASEGYLVAAPDYFFRTTPGPISVLEAAQARMAKHDIDRGVLDMEDAITQLRQHEACNGKIVVLGFCFGGLFAYLAGTRLNVDAVGAYHATRIHNYLNESDNLCVPASLHYGDADSVVPMDQVKPIQAKMENHQHCNVVLHPGGEHSFSLPNKPGYDEAIAHSAKQTVLDIFASV
jgi:carboxymethylenebutenolidase